MPSEITHDEAATIALKFINQHFNNPGKERPRASIPADPDRDDDLRLMEYIRQQRAATGVRVVEILQEPEDHNRSVDYPINIKAGQSLALIELAPTKAARGSVSMCMGCLGTGHMEGFGKCPHCKGTGECQHNKRSAEAAPSPR